MSQASETSNIIQEEKEVEKRRKNPIWELTKAKKQYPEPCCSRSNVQFMLQK